MSAGSEIIKLVGVAEIDDVRSGLVARYWFRVGSYILEAASELSLAIATILLALESALANPVLKYWAIGLNVGAISLRLLKSYSMRESRNRTLEVNIICKKLGVEELPDIVLNEELLSARSLLASAPPVPRRLSEV